MTTTTGELITRAFRYEAEQRLVEVAQDAATLATYAYDADGRRLHKEVGGQRTTYLYDNQQILADYSATGSLKARTVHGPGLDEPLLMVRAGRFSYLHQDGLGNS